MRRVPPWVGSVAVHAAVVAVWLAWRPGDEVERATREAAIEIVDVIAPPPIAAVEVAMVKPVDAGGEGARAGAGAAAGAEERKPAGVARRPRPQPMVPSPAPVTMAAMARMPSAAMTATAEETMRAAEAAAAAAAAAEANGNGSGNGNGNGNGSGNGNGNGNGDGDGDGNGNGTAREAFERMVSAPRSKARPARLVYPKRDRAEREDALFIVRLNVDEDGVVVGAKLQHAPPGRQTDRAMGAVFRFAYEPALDDAGRPIASVVEQRFMVE
jgi:outer membrane biosynthesis protein TonB